jgi:hypothetical protein
MLNDPSKQREASIPQMQRHANSLLPPIAGAINPD